MNLPPVPPRLPAPTPWKSLLLDRRLYVLIALSVLAVTLAYQWSEAYQVDLASHRDDIFLEGFYNPEHNNAGPFRWTGARADVRLPNLWPAQPVRLALTLSAPRPAGQGPVTVTLSLNGRVLDTLAAGPPPKSLSYDLEPGVLGVSGNLYLTAETTTFSTTTDTRQLGMTVSRIEVTPLGNPPVLPALPVLAVISASIGLITCWLRRLAAPPLLAAAAPIGLIAAAALGLLFARPIIAQYNAQVLFTLAVAFASSELAAWLGGYRGDVSAMRWTAALCLPAFGIRMILAHAPGDPANFIAFKMMIAQVAQHGLASIYELDPVVGAYPPVHHYDWALISFLYRTFVSPDFYVDSLRLNFMMKMPTIVLDMLITAILMGYAARRRSARFAVAAGAAYALNPGIIYTSAFNGQLGDPLYSLFVTVAVVALLNRRAATFGASAALALLTKPQASAFLPFFVIAGLRCLPWRATRAPERIVGQSGHLDTDQQGNKETASPAGLLAWREVLASNAVARAILGALVAALWVLLPFLLAGTVGQMLRTVSTTVGHGPRISANAYNIWWLLGWGQAWNIDDTGPLLGPLSYRAVGLILLFGVANGWIAWKLWSHRDARSLAMLAGFAGLAFFMLPTEIHENYLFPAIPLLVLFAVHDRRAWLAWLILSATWFVNLVFVDIDLMDTLTTWWPLLPSLVFPLQMTASLVNIGVLLAWGAWSARLGRE